MATANGVNFSGLGSGIDFNVIRDAILAQRARPITLMQQKATEYNSRIDSLRQLNAGVAAVTTAAKALTERDLGTGRNATTSDASIVGSTATGSAPLGQIEVNISRLATSLTQASRTFASSTAPLLVGAATTATFELRKGGATTGTPITIDETNNTLEGLRDAINAADAGVTASIVDLSGDGTQKQLILNSKDTGAKGRVELVETTTTGTGADLNIRSLNPPDGDFTKLDAKFTVNGLEVTRPSNTVSDAVTGVTLTLKKEGKTTVNVSASNDIENKMRAFVNAYNTVQDAIAGQYKKDAKGRPTGVLAGDATLRSVQQQLRDAINTDSRDNGGSLKNLAEIGLSIGEDGRMSFDSNVLSDKLSANAEDVKAFLFGKTEAHTGIFESIYQVSNNLSDSTTGTVQNAITGYQTSINTISDTVAKRTEMINNLRDTLTRQFAAADAAIGQLNGQGSALTSVMKSLQSNSDK